MRNTNVLSSRSGRQGGRLSFYCKEPHNALFATYDRNLAQCSDILMLLAAGLRF